MLNLKPGDLVWVKRAIACLNPNDGCNLKPIELTSTTIIVEVYNKLDGVIWLHAPTAFVVIDLYKNSVNLVLIVKLLHPQHGFLFATFPRGEEGEYISLEAPPESKQ